MKPIYEMRPISDHAKKLLNTMDNYPMTGELPASHPFHEKQVNVSSKLYGETRTEPLYTDKQIQSLEAMYGYNKHNRETSKLMVKRYSSCSILVTPENLHKFTDTLFADCHLQFENQDISNAMYKQGCRFRNCRVSYFVDSKLESYTLHKE